MSLEQETRDRVQGGKSKSMKDFEKDLDEASMAPTKKKTPEEMNQNPMDLLDPEHDPAAHQGELDSTWDVAEGKGPHDASINDNDSQNGPAR